MSCDRLFPIGPGFWNLKAPNWLVVCPHCNQIKSSLSCFSELPAKLDFVRVAFSRSHGVVISFLDAENQSLPAFVVGNCDIPLDAERHGAVAFAASTTRVLDLLAEWHGFSRLH